MNINWSDVLGQVIVWVIIGVISLVITLIKNRYSKSKNWFIDNWMFIAGVLLLGYSISQINIFTKSIIATVTSISFVFAICLLIMHFYIRSSKLNKIRNDELEIKFENKINTTSKFIKSYIDNFKGDFLMEKIEKWKSLGVEDNVITTCIEVIDIVSVASYNYEMCLNILEETIHQKKLENEKNDVFVLSEIRRILKKIPEEYSDIVHKIETNI